MKDPLAKSPIPRNVLSACCPEAQADGVPCTELGRDCETCERAIPASPQAVSAARALEADEKDDSWAV